MTDEQRVALNQRLGLVLIVVAVALSLVRPLAGALVAGVGVWLTLGAGLKRRRLRAAARAADPLVLPWWGAGAKAVSGFAALGLVVVALFFFVVAVVEAAGASVSKHVDTAGDVALSVLAGVGVASLAVWLLAAFWSGYREKPLR